MVFTYTSGVGNKIKKGGQVNQARQKILVNFKKSKSHIEKIIEMIEEDAYCIDLMQQNLAVIGLLRSAHLQLMENHLNTCFKKAIGSRNQKKKEQMTAEILQVTKLFNK